MTGKRNKGSRGTCYSLDIAVSILKLKPAGKKEECMLYVSIFDAKEDISIEEINREREEWFQKGRDKTFHTMCSRIDRFEVVGKSPMKIVFIIETDDPQALNILSHHFGDGWISVSLPVLQREMFEALEEDKTIIGG